MACFLYKLEHFFFAGFKGSTGLRLGLTHPPDCLAFFRRRVTRMTDSIKRLARPLLTTSMTGWIVIGKWVGKYTYPQVDNFSFPESVDFYGSHVCKYTIVPWIRHGKMTFITKEFIPNMEESSPKAYVRENPFGKKTWVRETFGDFRVKRHDFKYDTK